MVLNNLFYLFYRSVRYSSKFLKKPLPWSLEDHLRMETVAEATRPKELTREQMRSARKSEKKTRKTYASGHLSLQVLGNGSEGVPTCLYVNADSCRYMFNCGEGTQRLCIEHKLKLLRCDNIFITHNSWKNMGGTLGLALTLHELAVPECTFHGNPGVTEILNCTRGFGNLTEIEIHDCTVLRLP